MLGEIKNKKCQESRLCKHIPVSGMGSIPKAGIQNQYENQKMKRVGGIKNKKKRMRERLPLRKDTHAT